MRCFCRHGAGSCISLRNVFVIFGDKFIDSVPTPPSLPLCDFKTCINIEAESVKCNVPILLASDIDVHLDCPNSAEYFHSVPSDQIEFRLGNATGVQYAAAIDRRNGSWVVGFNPRVDRGFLEVLISKATFKGSDSMNDSEIVSVLDMLPKFNPNAMNGAYSFLIQVCYLPLFYPVSSILFDERAGGQWLHLQRCGVPSSILFLVHSILASAVCALSSLPILFISSERLSPGQRLIIPLSISLWHSANALLIASIVPTGISAGVLVFGYVLFFLMLLPVGFIKV